MSKAILRGMFLLAVGAFTVRAGGVPADEARLRQAVTFYASFDEDLRGDHGGGDLDLWLRADDPRDKGKKVYSRDFDRKRVRISKDNGVHGGALELTEMLPSNGFVYFPGKGKLAPKDGGWGGAVSVWIKADLARQPRLPIDPVQIAQKTWNNGALWCDFSPDRPPDLRWGVYPLLPDGQKPPDVPEAQQPTERLKGIEFKAGVWHHFLLSWDRFDTGKPDAVAAFYLDGKRLGTLKGRAVNMKWDVEQVRIYVGAGMVGLIDELAVFSRALTDAEAAQLHQHPGSLAGLRRKPRP